MNDAAENKDTDDQDQNLDQEQEQEQEREQQEENLGVSLASKAAEMGHQSHEDWVNNGGDADLWQTPETFLQLKPALTRLKDQGREIRRLKDENVTLTGIYGRQVENLRQQLTDQRSSAVEGGDVTKFNQVQVQLDNLPSPSEPSASVELSPFMQSWNADAKNDWYRNNEAKQVVANQRFAIYRQQGYSEEQTVVLMKQDVDRLVPDVNLNRNNAPRGEGGSKPGNKPGPRKPTMNDLTPQESKIWRSGHMMFKDEKEFLTMVAKTREEENE